MKNNKKIWTPWEREGGYCLWKYIRSHISCVKDKLVILLTDTKQFNFVIHFCFYYNS